MYLNPLRRARSRGGDWDTAPLTSAYELLHFFVKQTTRHWHNLRLSRQNSLTKDEMWGQVKSHLFSSPTIHCLGSDWVHITAEQRWDRLTVTSMDAHQTWIRYSALLGYSISLGSGYPLDSSSTYIAHPEMILLWCQLLILHVSMETEEEKKGSTCFCVIYRYLFGILAVGPYCHDCDINETRSEVMIKEWKI